MRAWKFRIDIYSAVRATEVKISYDMVNEELKKLPDDIIKSIPIKWRTYSERAIRDKDVHVFNQGLEYLYNWADENDVCLVS